MPYDHQGYMSTEKLAPHECASKEFLVWSVLEPVGRLGSFGVTDHVNPIGFSISHHVYIARTVLLLVCRFQVVLLKCTEQ